MGWPKFHPAAAYTTISSRLWLVCGISESSIWCAWPPTGQQTCTRAPRSVPRIPPGHLLAAGPAGGCRWAAVALRRAALVQPSSLLLLFLFPRYLFGNRWELGVLLPLDFRKGLSEIQRKENAQFPAVAEKRPTPGKNKSTSPRLANAPPASGPAGLLVAQMQGFPTHGVFLNPDRQPEGSTRPIFCVEREYGIRTGAWARENAVLAHSQKNLLAASGRSLKL